MGSMDIEKKILVAIYAARQNPKIKLQEVYRTLEENLNFTRRELLTIIKKLEASGMLNRSGKQGIFSFVLSAEGRIYVDSFNQSFSDQLISAAKKGEWVSILAVLTEYVFKDHN